MTGANELSGMFTSHTFLHGLEERHRLLLASGARPFKAGPGQLLLRQGQEADAFYLIQSGQVALSVTTPRGEEVPIGPQRPQVLLRLSPALKSPRYFAWQSVTLL